MSIDRGRSYRARVETERGSFSIRLLPDAAPVAVNSFVFLAREGFFDGTTFHRVVPGFLAQAGDPLGTGRGGPGYRFDDEPSDVPFERGVAGMANAGPNTNGSQFFILLADAPHLNRRFTAFGRVEDGFEVVSALTPRDPATAREAGDRIDSVKILEG